MADMKKVYDDLIITNLYVMFPHDILGLISLVLSLVDMLLLRILENNKTSCFTHSGLSEAGSPLPRFWPTS